MSTKQQVWLVTAAGRGLGKGFVATLLQRPGTTVIAATRHSTSTGSKHLFSLDRASESQLIVVKIDSESGTDPEGAVTELQSEHGINHIDVVIANAATLAPPATTAAASIDDLRKSYQVNAFAPLLLFQATWALLQKSKSPKFVGISTCVASLSKMEDYPWPTVVYGSSKAAMNYIVKKMHHENDDLVAFAVHPGLVLLIQSISFTLHPLIKSRWVQTDSGNGFAKAQGLEQAPDSVQQSVDFILSKVRQVRPVRKQ